MADTTVTGQFGRENVSLNNAASEATLLKLVAAVERMGKGSGGRVEDLYKQSQQSQRAYNKELDTSTGSLKTSTAAFNKLAGSIGALSSKVASFAGGVISGAIDVVKGLGTELVMGGNRLSDFSQHIKDVPVLGLSHQLIAFLDQQVTLLNDLSMSGASFNNSILAMREAATRAGSDFKQFADLIKNNTSTMAALGGTVTQGANRFASLAKQFKESDVGKQLINMGYTVNGVDEALVSFIETSVRGNKKILQSDSEIIEAAGRVSLNLDQIAKLTGQNINEIRKQSQANQELFKVRTMIGGLKGEAYTNAKAAFDLIGTAYKPIQEGLLDLADGIAQTPEGMWLQQLDKDGKLRETLRSALTEGAFQPQAFAEAMAVVGQRLDQEAQNIIGTGRQGAARLQALSASNPEFAKVLDGLSAFRQTSIGASNAASAEQQATNKVTETLRQFELQMIRLRTEIQNSFFDSNLFERIQNIANHLFDSNRIQGLTKEITRLMTGSVANLDRFMGDLGKAQDLKGMVEAFKKMFTNTMALVFDLDASKPLQDQLHEKFRNWVADIFSLDKNASLKNQINNIIKEFVAGMFGVSAYTTKKDAAGNIYQEPKSWGQIAGEAFVKEVKGGSTWAIVATAIGAGIVGYLVLKLGSKILGGGGGPATGGFDGPWNYERPQGPSSRLPQRGGRGGDSIGMSLLKGGVGLGAGLAATALGLLALNEAFEKLEKIDWVKLKDGIGIIAGVGVATGVAGALISLASPIGMLKMLGAAAIIAAFGAALIPYGYAAGLAADASVRFSEAMGNVIDKISNYKTAQTDATTRQIKEISEISPENLKQSAAAVDSLKKALAGFDKGLFAGISTGLGRLFGPDTTSDLTKIASLGPGLKNSADGLEAFKAAVTGLNLSGFGMTQEQIAGLRHLQMANLTNLEKLPRVGDNMGNAAQGVKSFKEALVGLDFSKFDLTSDQITRLTNGTNKVKDLATQIDRTREAVKKLDDQGVTKITTGLKNLSDAFEEFSKSFVDKFIAALDKTKAESQLGLLNEIKSQLERLNSSAQSINTHTENTARKVGVTTPPGTVYPQRR